VDVNVRKATKEVPHFVQGNPKRLLKNVNERKDASRGAFSDEFLNRTCTPLRFVHYNQSVSDVVKNLL